MKKCLSLILALVMMLTMLPMGVHAQTIDIMENVKVLSDTPTERVAVCGNVTATLDKTANIMYVKDTGASYAFSLELIQTTPANTTKANQIIQSESVALHRYQHVRTDSGSYYYAVDIPSYDINPNNWCGWISVWDDGSEEAEYAEEFIDYIEAAQDNENTISIYGGAAAVSVVVTAVTKNPAYSESAMKAILAAADIAISYGLLSSIADYYNNLKNAREDYFAIRRIVG